jgi:acyl-coenzyme A thioesterase PaaI-like protein
VRRAVLALRAIGDELVGARGRGDEDLAAVAAGLEAVLARLRDIASPAGSAAAGIAEPGGDRLLMAVDTNPNVGLHNYVAPPIRLRTGPDPAVLYADVRYRSCHQGPPGCVHGGQIAAFFDELLLSRQTMDGVGGVTAQLSIRYVRPVPLHTDLVGEARVDRQDGRKRYIRGKLAGPDGVLLAEAEALALPLPAR